MVLVGLDLVAPSNLDLVIIACPLQSMQSYTLLLMTMRRVLIDLMTLDIYDMATRTLADRVAGCAEII